MTERFLTSVLWCLIGALGFAVIWLSLKNSFHPASSRILTCNSLMPTVTQLERIGELAAIRVHVTDILYAEGEGYRGSWLINGDAMLSCDLSKAELVVTDSKTRTVAIRLPAIRMTSARVNHENTKTWCVERTSWLPWKWGDQGAMRDAAMFHAQQLIEEAATSRSHLDAARAQTERLLQQVFGLNDWKVAIEWQ